MKIFSPLVLFLLLSTTSVASAEEVLTGMPVVADPAVPMRDTLATTYIDTTRDPARDTLFIAVRGVIIKQVAVNAYVQVVKAVAFPMKPVYHVGSWSELVTFGKRAAPDLVPAGVWRGIVTVPRKPGTTFTVVMRDGNRRDLQPVDP